MTLCRRQTTTIVTQTDNPHCQISKASYTYYLRLEQALQIPSSLGNHNLRLERRCTTLQTSSYTTISINFNHCEESTSIESKYSPYKDTIPHENNTTTTKMAWGCSTPPFCHPYLQTLGICYVILFVAVILIPICFDGPLRAQRTLGLVDPPIVDFRVSRPHTERPRRE